MTNVKTYKDGSRLIIVVENCTGTTAEKVNNFLLDILGAAPAKDVPGLVPSETAEPPMPEIRVEDEITPDNPAPFAAPSSEEIARGCAVEGAAGTLGHAIDIGDTAAIVRLTTSVHKLDESLKYTVLEMCKKYILDDCICREPENSSVREIKRFFADYNPLIKTNVTEILNMAGYANIDLFFSHANEMQLRAAYQSILDCLIERVSKN